VAAPARLADSTWPGYGWSSGGWSDPYAGGSDSGGTGSTGSSTGSTDTQSATAGESRGVVLIDTQLYDGSQAAGTGIVLTSAGRVLTNYHVVEGSTTVKVTVASTGKTYTAKLVGADQSADVALLQLKNAGGLTTAQLDNDQVAVGDDVTAVGNAGGTGVLSAADGSVTALEQDITTASEGITAGEDLSGLIQTDADIQAGDSGGPLLDDEGEVVGIDTAASSGGQVQGYAIPIEDALSVVAKINSGTETAQVRIGPAAYLGVQVTDAATTDTSQGYGSGFGDGGQWGYGSGSGSIGSGGTGLGSAGAAVSGVTSGGPASAAGIGAGDVITKVGSSTVGSVDDLTQALKKYQPGDTVAIGWTDSSGTQHTATVTLGASPVN
jgi:S1-C subfamily serine protease